MGGTTSYSIFDSKYQKERVRLRQELMRQFENNPKNQDILSKIQIVRDIITQNPHICETAARELEKVAEFNPTVLQSAFNELDRLLTIYETGTILKSAQCRMGNTACPIGHYAAYFDDIRIIVSDPKIPVLCKICDRKVKDGYHCSFCNYTMCVPCSVIYCCNGHALKLWTHPESQHSCIVCNSFPISSGYKCIVCEDYDICDMCTWKPGRKKVQAIIHKRMEEDIAYMRDHQSESATALKTIANYREDAYHTTLDLYKFQQSLDELKEMTRQEVIQTRRIKAINAYREKLIVGREFSKTAYEESLISGRYVEEELVRLHVIADLCDKLASVAFRSKYKIACPLGHGMPRIDGVPDQYKKYKKEYVSELEKREEEERRLKREGSMISIQDDNQSLQSANTSNTGAVSNKLFALFNSTKNKESTKKTKKNEPEEIILVPLIAFHQIRKARRHEIIPPQCRICNRLATPCVYHCDYCAYDLCEICSVIVCGEGHNMTMWTEPYSTETCFLCKDSPIHQGYFCSICQTNICDRCTLKENRNKIRKNWETELNSLLAFMQENKRLSDVALFYHWRHTNQVVSTALLVEYVRELRLAKKKALKQIDQKDIIDKIKLLRSEVTQRTDICATALAESTKQEYYIFPSKKDAIKEMNRLADIIKDMLAAQTIDRRSAAGVACPLAHAMDKIDLSINQEEFADEILPPETVSSPETISSPDPLNIKIDNKEMGSPPSSPEGSPLPSPSKFSYLSHKHIVEKMNNSLVESTKSPKFPMTDSVSQLYSPMKESTKKLIDLVNLPTQDMLINDFSTLSSNQVKNRWCKVCGTNDIHLGHHCKICEYDLCKDCSIMYCRMGHPLRIWTLPEAHCLSCDICKTAPITSGYRCLICNIDICDLCTTRDTRNAFMLWPRREFHRILQSIETMATQSKSAKDYLDEYNRDTKKVFLQSMSKLCKKLQEIEIIRTQCEVEIKEKQKESKTKKYGLTAREML